MTTLEERTGVRPWPAALATVGVVATVGALASGNVVAGAGVAGVILVWAIGSRWPAVSVDFLILLGFTTTPNWAGGVPEGARIGGFYIYFYEIVLLVAVGYSITRLRRIPGLASRLLNTPTTLFLILFVATLVIGSLHGYAAGFPTSDIQYELRPTVAIVGAAFVAAVVVARQRIRRHLPVVLLSLWVSALEMLAASTVGLKISGRSEDAQLYTTSGKLIDGGSKAERLLTQTTPLALTAVLVCVALLILGTTYKREVIAFLIPAILVTFFSFSRNAVLGIGVMIIVMLLVAVINRTFLQVVGRLGIAVLAIALIGGVGYFGLTAVGASGWVNTQISGYSNRVFSGLQKETRAVDTSTQDREIEDHYLGEAIKDHELFGSGLGLRYKPPTGPPDKFAAQQGQMYAHDYYGWLFAKAGLIAVMALSAIFLSVLYPVVVRRWRGMYTVAVAAAMAGLAAVLFVSPMPNDLDGALIFGSLTGFGIARWSTTRHRTPDTAAELASAPGGR